MPGVDGQRSTVYFEHVAIGNAVKVTAIDASTGIEVSIVGPIRARAGDLERLALRKLERRLADGPPGAD